MAGAIGKFGKKVIGATQAAAEAEQTKVRVTKFGPAVMGKGRSLAGARAAELNPRAPGAYPVGRQAVVDQPREGRAAVPAVEVETPARPREGEAAPPERIPEPAGPGQPPPGVAPDIAPPQDGELHHDTPLADHATVELGELERTLTEQPALLDRFLAAEFGRAEGPRRDALRILDAAERAREGGARAAVVDAIAARLATG